MNVLRSAVSHGLVGFGLFAAWGAFKGVMAQNENETQDDYYTANIDKDVFAREAIDKLKTYQHHAPEEFKTIVTNIDLLIGLQLLIQNNQTQANMPYKAIRYYMNVEQALKSMEYKLRNVVTPHFEMDKEAVLTIAKNYKHNINVDSNVFIMNSRQLVS